MSLTSKFCIGEKVVVNYPNDPYCGYLARVTNIRVSTFDEVPSYEIRFIEDNPPFPNDCRIGIYPEYDLASPRTGYYDPKFIAGDIISYDTINYVDSEGHPVKGRAIAQIMYFTHDPLNHRYIYTTTRNVKLYETPTMKKLNNYSKLDFVCFKRSDRYMDTKVYGYIQEIRVDYLGNISYDISSSCGDSYVAIPQEDILWKLNGENNIAEAKAYEIGGIDRNGKVHPENVVKAAMLKKYLNSKYGLASLDPYIHDIHDVQFDGKFLFDREKLTKLEREYCINDCLITKELIEQMMRYNVIHKLPEIKKVHFSNGVTVVIFDDGTKSIVKCQEGETFDPEKGLAMAICKKVLGTNKSGSNYYDEFKKWLPKEEEKKEEKVGPIDVTLHTGHSVTLDLSNPCVGCTDRKNGCLTNCQKMQEYVDGIREESKPEPIEPGYFIKHSEERKNRPKPVAGNPVPVKKEDPVPLPISTFVDKFEGALFPQEFISFCKKNGLAFYIVDEIKGGLKKVDPYRVTWQQVTGYLKRGLMESCKKVKCHKNATTSFLAVYMDKALFSKIIAKEEN